MTRDIIQKLIEHLRAEYAGYVPYGTSDAEEEGTGFRIEGIPATFSVLSYGDIPEDILDIQIESYQPGNYLYNAELSIEDFIRLIETYRRPESEWPR